MICLHKICLGVAVVSKFELYHCFSSRLYLSRLAAQNLPMLQYSSLTAGKYSICSQESDSILPMLYFPKKITDFTTVFEKLVVKSVL